MSPLALTIVLVAAVLHASWNALVKAAADRAVTLALVAGVHAVVGIALIVLFEPPAPASWPSILASTLIHYLYYALLFQAYRLGDLSQIYPIARGLAPAIVAFGVFLLIGEKMSPLGWTGLAAISIGIGLLALQRGAVNAEPRAIGAAMLLGLTIAAYSIADGIGIRLSQSPGGYMGWLFLLEAPVTLFILSRRAFRKARITRQALLVGIGGGVFSVTAYGLALYAKTIAPIGAVSAVRESSVIIAALIGIIFLGERPWVGRILCAAIVAAGVIVLSLAG